MFMFGFLTSIEHKMLAELSGSVKSEEIRGKGSTSISQGFVVTSCRLRKSQLAETQFREKEIKDQTEQIY